MAQRRMFNVSIINSARFLKMPIDAQNLYFHLGLRADDDGVVEAYTVMKQIGSSEDNLKVLSAKAFIKVLNEDLVAYILDWNDHNCIRADRKIDSIYKDLLIQIIPDIKLIEAKERADKKSGRPLDNQRTTNGPHRLGKYRLGKGSLDKLRINKKKKKKTINYAFLVKDYSSNQELINKVLEFFEFRKSIKKPVAENSVNSWLKKLDKLSSIDSEKIEIIDESIANGYQGIFPLKQQQNTQQQPKSNNPFLDMLRNEGKYDD